MSEAAKPDPLEARIARLSPEQRRRLLAKLAGATRRPVGPASTPGAGPFPASAEQEHFWALDRLNADRSAYCVRYAARLEGPLDRAALHAALARLVERHAALRTRLERRGGRLWQHVEPAGDVALNWTDLSALPEADRERSWRRSFAEELAAAFDLGRAPLVRCGLWCLGPREHVLGLVVHHAACDASSLSILLGDLGRLYAALATGVEPALDPPVARYVDYALRQQAWDHAPSLEYWKATLEADAAAHGALGVCADYARPVQPSGRGAEHSLRLGGPVHAALLSQTRQERTTPFLFLLTAYALLLARYTGSRDVRIGAPFGLRDTPDLASVVGPFVNTLVLRLDLGGRPTFRELLARVRAVVAAAHAHRRCPYLHLAQALGGAGSAGRGALFQTLFAYEEENPPPELPGLRVTRLPLEPQTALGELGVTVVAEPAALSLLVEYDTDLFAPGTVAGFAGAFAALLEDVSLRPEARAGELGLVDSQTVPCVPPRPAPGPALLGRLEWAGPGRPREERTLHALVSAQAARTPHALACMRGAERLSYRELDERANALAERLVPLGAAPDKVVAVLLPRSLEAVVAFLAVLKAGAAFLPIEEGLPLERLAYQLDHSQAVALVVSAATQARLPGRRPPVCRVGGAAERCAQPPQVAVDEQHLAYVIYTSGSTGQPKAVGVSHAAAAAQFAVMAEELHLAPGERLLQFAALSFDWAVEDLFATWLAGACVVLRGPSLWSIPELVRVACETGVTVACLPTAYWEQLTHSAGALARLVSQGVLHTVSVGGDAMKPGHVAAWKAAVGERVRLLNGYGPTEATVDATGHAVGAGDGPPRARVPIGRALFGRTAFVLDAEGRPLPAGAVGELYLGGHLARGYLRAPTETAAAFVPNPFGAPGERLYRSGDMVRVGPDGNLEFVGRRDGQVKIRGFRVEVCEVENALGQHPLVAQAAVRTHRSADSALHLAAYVVARPGARVDGDAVRLWLRGKLPHYMVPSTVSVLDELPQTAHGKLDRQALPLPQPGQQRLPERPQTSFERAMAALWMQVLGSEPRARDDFFELGGDSLRLLQLLELVKARFDVDLEAVSVYAEPTVEGMVRAVRQRIRAPLVDAALDLAAPPLRRAAALTALVPADGRPAVFLVHPAGGHLTDYRELVAALRAHGRQVFGFESPGLRDGSTRFDSLEDMAGAYVSELRAVRLPPGPLALVGYCSGGLVALEMARQLAAARLEVAPLVLVDTEPGEGPGSPPSECLPSALLAGFATELRLDPPPAAFDGLSAEQGLELVAQALARDFAETAAWLTPEVLARLYRVYANNVEIEVRYRMRPYPGTVTLVEPEERVAPSGWERVTTGGLVRHVIPGNHVTCLLPPHVGHLAACICGLSGAGR